MKEEKEIFEKIVNVTKELSELFKNCSEKFNELGSLVSQLNNDSEKKGCNHVELFLSEDSLPLNSGDERTEFNSETAWWDEDSSKEDLTTKEEVEKKNEEERKRDEEKVKEEYERKELERQRLKDIVRGEFKDIHESIDNLSEKSNELYPKTSLNVYVRNAKANFDKLIKDIKEGIEQDSPLDDLKRRCLMEGLELYGWANVFMRIYAYAGIQNFKTKDEEFSFTHMKSDMKRLGEIIINLYKSNGVEIVIPSLLETKFDGDAYDYDNSSDPIIPKFCNLNPDNYKDQTIYDLIKVGYNVYIDEEKEKTLNKKPTVYYIQ